jgi:hypothetical protein
MGSTADNPREDEELPECDGEANPERLPPEQQRPRRRQSDRRQLDTPAVAGPAFAEAERDVRDLSEDLMATLPRESGQVVRCRHISGDHYRCNWWGSRDAARHDNPGPSGMMVTRYRVMKSRMLRATLTQEGVSVNADQQQ